jgi:hypothetical protein
VAVPPARTWPRAPHRPPTAAPDRRTRAPAPCPLPSVPAPAIRSDSARTVPVVPVGSADSPGPGPPTVPVRSRPAIPWDQSDRVGPPTARGVADRAASALVAVGRRRASRRPLGAATGGPLPPGCRAGPGGAPVAERRAAAGLAAAALTAAGLTVAVLAVAGPAAAGLPVAGRNDLAGSAAGSAACRRDGAGPGPRRSHGTQGRPGKPRRRGRRRAGCRRGQACCPDDSPGTS